MVRSEHMVTPCEASRNDLPALFAYNKIVDNVGLIYKTCDLAGIPYATPDNIPPDDQAVWDSIKEDTTMIFQWESPSATAYLKQLFSESTIEKIKSKNPNVSYMDLFSIGNGAIRPAGDSYRDKLANGEYATYGNEALDDFLKPTLGFCIYQEEVIEFLHKFCGFTMGEADIVRRCVDEDTLITTSSGYQMPIKDLRPGDSVISFSDDGHCEIDRVNEVFDNGIQLCYKLVTISNRKIVCTANHKILTRNGYKCLSELLAKDEIFTAFGFTEKIKYIAPFGKRHVYDIEVDKNHNYIANNIIVHNCFAKKLGTENMIPIIENGGSINENHHIDGFIKVMHDQYGVEEEEAKRLIKSFLQVIIDASDYLFSKNHADPYSWIGYICGYLRYYYPLEFITTALNIFASKEDKSLAIINYAKKQGIRISSIKFRHSIADYSFDKETNQIFKGLASIKYMNADVANELYQLRDKHYEDFIDMLIDLHNTSINARQLNILIELDFFEEFGDANRLIAEYEIFDKFYGRHQVRKDMLSKMGIPEESVRNCAREETEKMFSQINSSQLLHVICSNLKTHKRTFKERVNAQMTHLGYIDIIGDEYANMAVVMNIDTKYSPKLQLYSLKNGNMVDVKIDKRTFAKTRLSKMDVVRIISNTIKPKSRRLESGGYEAIPGTKEIWLTNYKVINEL